MDNAVKNNFNVVGDVAGQFKTLKALLAKMPQDAELICLGDPNDRGPNSKEVIEFLMQNGRTVQSNHAHLFTEHWKQCANPGAYPRYYEHDIFFYNGGGQTMQSYAGQSAWGEKGTVDRLVPRSHIEFLEKCPMYIESEDFFFSHAPLAANYSIKNACRLGDGFNSFMSDPISDKSLIWNRYVPDKPQKALKGKINVFGHNSSSNIKLYTTQYPNGIKITTNDQFQELWSMRNEYPVFAICLDTSSVRVLTGLHLPTMTYYEQEYLDDSSPVRGPYGSVY